MSPAVTTNLPDIAGLSINGAGPPKLPANPLIPQDIACAAPDDKYLYKLKEYARNLPYSVESNARMQDMLDFILTRLTQCIEAKDYDPGLMQWDSMLQYWMMLRYPFPKEKRIAVIKLYYHLATTPGMPMSVVTSTVDRITHLVRSRKKLSIDDMRLPWLPIFKLLRKDLFLQRRRTEYDQLANYMGHLAENIRRFFHPAAIDEMLSTFLPLFNGTSIDSVLSTEFHLISFLPLSHPQSYLPMLFRLWESINSYNYDGRMLELLSYLARMHSDPGVSDPRRVQELPDDERSDGEGRPDWDKNDLPHIEHGSWGGVYKDVGIFTYTEWNLLMSKCLSSMEIPLGNSDATVASRTVDGRARFEVGRLPKALGRLASLAQIIVYSMVPDSVPAPASTVATPMFTPDISRPQSPFPGMSPAGHIKESLDYLSAPVGRLRSHHKPQARVGGSRALESFVKLIASLEGFFHPNNAGSWTADLCGFISQVLYAFNQRWHEEQLPDCKTPKHRRLTRRIRRELVKCLRPVVLVALFSEDSTIVSKIQSCLKQMCFMEPDLILQPILDRAVPGLEALEETHRTIAVMQGLQSVMPCMVSRHLYYPGAKHILPILQLLLPAIDLNDPTKTITATSLLVDIGDSIVFGDLSRSTKDVLSSNDYELFRPKNGNTTAFGTPQFENGGFLWGGGRNSHNLLQQHHSQHGLPMPHSFGDIDLEDDFEDEKLSNSEEDQLVRETTGEFAGWVEAFVRRVIQLIENLPEEGANGGVGGGFSEAQIIDAVGGACGVICLHLSEPIYAMVLNMIYEYATTNVRNNAVRAIHQLVEAVSQVDPARALEKFFPFCSEKIYTELENGASSIRTTASDSPRVLSDATLHWNFSILRGVLGYDGRTLLKHQNDLLRLFTRVHEKTFSERGYNWGSQLLYITLNCLTDCYVLDDRFVNDEEWNSEEFRASHHKFWGKVYKSEDIKILWHVPNAAEIDFALRILRELVEPTLETLEKLLDDSITRDATWRNDFCRHLCLVKDAFSGVRSLAMIVDSEEDKIAVVKTGDIYHEIPEMIGMLEPLNSSFVLQDPKDPRHQYVTGLRQRFGRFLHDASVSLRSQGEENTVDAVQMLIDATRVFLLEYGNLIAETYSTCQTRYNNVVSNSLLYDKQKVWSRTVWVRRARYYHAKRLNWASISSLEHHRGTLEDLLFDDLVEWSLWHYPSVRGSGQSVLVKACSIYTGVRRRAIPQLLKALEPGTEDDRMKGALWTIYNNTFLRNAFNDPPLSRKLIKTVLSCQHNEKPSIQVAVSDVYNNMLNKFNEPCFLIYDIDNELTNKALSALSALLSVEYFDEDIIRRSRDQRVQRTSLINETSKLIASDILEIANASRIHWKYGIFSLKCLLVLIRVDEPISSKHMQYLLSSFHNANPTMRYHAREGLLKVMRYIKLRGLCRTPEELAMGIVDHPFKRKVPVPADHEFTQTFFNAFKAPVVLSSPRKPVYFDKLPPGWLVWQDSIELYVPPGDDQSAISPSSWSKKDLEALEAIRTTACEAEYWSKLATYFGEEKEVNYLIQYHVGSVKSILQLLGEEPLEVMKPTVEKLLGSTEKDKQRGGAEFAAGIIGGSKHWPTNAQNRMWEWLMPLLRPNLSSKMKTDTLPIWTSFMHYVFARRDPRRLQPLADHVIDTFKKSNFNSESSFEALKVLNMFRVLYLELSTKFRPWLDETMNHFWPEIQGEHDDTRSHVSALMSFADKITWQPRPSVPDAETFVRECRTTHVDFDIMGMRGTYHIERIEELAEKFVIWRAERVPGPYAFQSTYDRVGISICKWLYQCIQATRAIHSFDYILPLMPELFRFTEVIDNDELVDWAGTVLTWMCGITPPASMINPILDAIFQAIRTSKSRRARMTALPLLQVFYFRQMPLISDAKVLEILEVLCQCLGDEDVEVRERAATTLSGVIRLSPRSSVTTLRNRFERLAKDSYLPDRTSLLYPKKLRERHAAVLGICALVDSYPYTVPVWLPNLLTSVLVQYTYDPIPICTSVRKCASTFRKTHQDTWHEDSQRFNPVQLASLQTLLTGSSYYA